MFLVALPTGSTLHGLTRAHLVLPQALIVLPRLHGLVAKQPHRLEVEQRINGLGCNGIVQLFHGPSRSGGGMQATRAGKQPG